MAQEQDFVGRSLVLPDEIIYSKFGAAFDFSKIEQFIDSRAAYDLVWARALKCSCRFGEQTDQPDPNCAKCGGKGRRYVHPDPENYPEKCEADGSVVFTGGMPIRGILSGLGLQADHQDQAGDFYHGRAEVTVKGSVELGTWDRFVMLDSEMAFDQVILRPAGVNTVSVGRNTDLDLRYPAVRVLALHTLTTRYRLRTDFTVSRTDGSITFVTGRGPASGERFSVRYTYHPTWVVIDFPRAVAGARRWGKHSGLGVDTYQRLPMTATIALEFLT